MFSFEDQKRRSPVTMSIGDVYRYSFQLLWLVPVLLIYFAKDVDEHVHHTFGRDISWFKVGSAQNLELAGIRHA